MTIELLTSRLWWSVSSEFVANFFHIFLGMGSVIVTKSGDALTVCLCFSFVVYGLTSIFGHSGGAHLNPIVSIAMSFTRQMSPVAALVYVVAQVFSSILARITLQWVFDYTNETMVGFDTIGNVKIRTILLDIILSCIRVFVFLMAHDPVKKKSNMGFAVGLTVGLAEAVAIPMSVTSGINPARSFAFAVPNQPDATLELWLFITVPFLGSLISGLMYPFWFTESLLDVKHEVPPLNHL